VVAPSELRDYLLREATAAPELWHQKAYLARVVTVDPDGTLRDAGILPLVHALDGMTRDLAAMTIESDGKGALYPVVYVRRDGVLSEHALPEEPLLDFATEAHRVALDQALERLLGTAAGR
jgi:hypothetical protein